MARPLPNPTIRGLSDMWFSMICWAIYAKLLSRDPLFWEPEVGDDIILYNEDSESIFKSIDPDIISHTL
jgi:hypothetical protein